MKKILFIPLVFLMLILGGLWAYQNFYPGKISNSKTTPTPTSTAEQPPILLSVQKPGQFVSVSYASLAKTGYVVIREDNNGNFGKILGNSRILPAGESRDVFVGLTRTTISGEYLFAVIYEDSGDKIFSPGLDVPSKDGDGNILFMRFNIQ